VASALPWQITLSLLALEFASGGTAQREEAGIIGLIIVLLTVDVALIAAVRDEYRATASVTTPRPGADDRH